MLRLENFQARGGAALTLTLEAGQCLGLSGPSGAGKSLLLRAIADLDPHQGTVSLNGRAQTEMSGPEWRAKVAYLPTESGWWANRVGEHLGEAAADFLPRLGLPAAALEWPVARLSTGERQRLALIRALCPRPPALLLDEPTATLDADSTSAVEALIRERLEHGAVVILVSHDAAQSARLAGNTLEIGKGRAPQ